MPRGDLLSVRGLQHRGPNPGRVVVGLPGRGQLPFVLQQPAVQLSSSGLEALSDLLHHTRPRPPIGTIDIPCSGLRSQHLVPPMPAAVEPLAQGRGQSLHEAAALEAAPAPALRQRRSVVSPSEWLRQRLERQETWPFRDEDHSIWHRPSTIPAHPRRPGAARPAVRRPPRLARGGLREPWSLQRSQGPEVSGRGIRGGTFRLDYPQPSWLSPVRTSPPTAPGCGPSARSPRRTCRFGCDGRRLRGGNPGRQPPLYSSRSDGLWSVGDRQRHWRRPGAGSSWQDRFTGTIADATALGEALIAPLTDPELRRAFGGPARTCRGALRHGTLRRGLRVTFPGNGRGPNGQGGCSERREVQLQVLLAACDKASY